MVALTQIAKKILMPLFLQTPKSVAANHTRSVQIPSSLFTGEQQLNLLVQARSIWSLWFSLLWMNQLRCELFLQCSWTSSRRARWSSVLRGTSMPVTHPPWSRCAWRRCAPTSRPEASSRTRTARWAPGFRCLHSLASRHHCRFVCLSLQL